MFCRYLLVIRLISSSANGTPELPWSVLLLTYRGALNTIRSCVKRKTNLMPLILLFIQYSLIAQHVSAVNTTIFRSLRLTG